MAEELKKFHALLSETILAPRLSARKITDLTTLFLSSSSSSPLLNAFFQLNQSLPSPGQSRISSLYVFDAIARGVQKAASNSDGAAKFGVVLERLEVVVESWIEGMMKDTKTGGVWVEGREKAKKVIDIWKSKNTFPEATLDHLSSKLAASSSQLPPPPPPVPSTRISAKVEVKSTTPPFDPVPPVFSPTLPARAAIGLPDMPGGGVGASGTVLPSDILKLLGAATPQPTTQASASAAVPPPPRDYGTSELAAILSKLPQAQQNGNSSPHIPSQNIPTLGGGAVPLGGLDPAALASLAQVAGQFAPAPPPPSSNLGYAQSPLPAGSGHNQRSNQYQNAEADRGTAGYNNNNDNDNGPRHGPRHGGEQRFQPPPPRDRDQTRDSQYEHDYDRRPGPGGRGSYGGETRSPRQDRRGKANEYEYDRPGPSHNRDQYKQQGRRDRGWDNGPQRRPRSRSRSRSRSPEWKRNSRAGAAAAAQTDEFGREIRALPATTPLVAAAADLSTFDMNAFNPADPGSWTALAQAWKVSHGGVEPSQMEIMQWVMMAQAQAGGGGGW